MISDATFIMYLSMVVHCWLPACIQPIVAAQIGGGPKRQSKQTLLAGKSPTKIDVSEKENHLKMGGFICVHFSSICLWAQKVFSTLMALFLAHSIFSATMQRCEEVYNFNKDDCMLAASVFLAILSFNGLV